MTSALRSFSSTFIRPTDRDARWLLAAALLTCVTAATGVVRFSLVGTHTWTFLLKNMFLAWIPGLVAFGLIRSRRLPTAAFVTLCLLWLTFLPNAPYIVTDVIHLSTPRRTVLWLDVLVVGSASLAGLLLTFASTEWTLRAVAMRLNRRTMPLTAYMCVIALAAFGVYFGRFARWNSWEIVTRPGDLVTDFAQRIVASDPWIFAAIFGGCLAIGQYVFHLMAAGPEDQRPRVAPVHVDPKTSE